MDVFARHRALGMTNERRDGYLGETEIVGNAGEAVTQDVWRHIRQRRFFEELPPVIREGAEGVVLTLPGEDVCTNIDGAPPLKILDDRKANGANGFSLLTVLQSQTARLGVGLRGISNWVWPLELPNRILSPRVNCARHALALDDERTTLH